MAAHVSNVGIGPTYGANVDWYKNVVAAGGCTVVWRGKDYAISGVEPLDARTGMAAYPPLMQIPLRILRRHDFVKLVER